MSNKCSGWEAFDIKIPFQEEKMQSAMFLLKIRYRALYSSMLMQVSWKDDDHFEEWSVSRWSFLGDINHYAQVK